MQQVHLDPGINSVFKHSILFYSTQLFHFLPFANLFRLDTCKGVRLIMILTSSVVAFDVLFQVTQMIDNTLNVVTTAK